MPNPIPIPTPANPKPRLPSLKNGDRLTRAEFHRRYRARPDIQRAELIEGVVHVAAAAARYGFHGRPDNALNGILFLYAASTPGVEGGGNTTTILDDENEHQPDCLLRIVTEAGGQSTIDDDEWLIGGPELVGEVSASTVAQDLHQKLNAYQRNGVREYLVWRVMENAVDWFVLRDGKYDVLLPDAIGIVRSVVFPGLWLDVPALLRGEFAAVVKVLTEGLASPEHVAFVAELQAKMASIR